MPYKKRNQDNVIKFPGTENKEVEEQDNKTAKTVYDITIKLKEPVWDIQHIHDAELGILSQFGEVLEFEPIVARRLIANLATELKKLKLETINPWNELI